MFSKVIAVVISKKCLTIFICKVYISCIQMKSNENNIFLINQIKLGDINAFEKLYDDYSPSIFGIISNMVKSDDIGEDLCQDVFVKIWKNIHSYDESKGSIFTWMLNIARNTAIDFIRSNKNKLNAEIQNQGKSVNEIKQVSASENFSINHIGIRDLINKLYEDQQLMIDYIYFRGYTHQEVADELAMPLGTVKTKIRNALINLRKAFNTLFWM